jgi:hypothetical protein
MLELPFRYVVIADFEFEFGGHASADDAGRSGERPRPVCMVAKELRSGQTWRLWRGQFGSTPPFPTGPDSLFVAFYASAELGCFRALGWPKPSNILDLFVEFRDRTNGLTSPAGAGLIGALTYFRLDNIGATDKDDMRALILAGGPWSESARQAILDYCAGDVAALERLLPAMLRRIDLPRALLRGRYMAAAAAMEFAGVPIDVPTLTLLRENWPHIQADLIAAIDVDYGSSKATAFAPTAGRNISLNKEYRGRDYLAAGSTSATTHSGRWQKPIPKCRRCASCAAHFPSCGSTTWRLAPTVATGRSFQLFALAPGGTSQVTRNSSSVLAYGCAR